MNFFRKASFYIWLFFIFILSIVILFYLNLVYYNIQLNVYFYISLLLSFVSLMFLILYSFMKINSISTYLKILKKFDLSEAERLNLDITFPESDEFGNLGKYLNNFVKTLSDFDNLKKEKITLLDRESDMLMNLVNIPVIIVDDKLEIVKVNDNFYKEFKINSKKDLKNTKITVVFQGEEAYKFFTEMISDELENKKSEVFCEINNVNYTLNFSFEKISSYNSTLNHWIIFINKKHRSIFNK